MQMAMKWNLPDVNEGNVLEPENQADTLMQPDTAALADRSERQGKSKTDAAPVEKTILGGCSGFN